MHSFEAELDDLSERLRLLISAARKTLPDAPHPNAQHKSLAWWESWRKVKHSQKEKYAAIAFLCSARDRIRNARDRGLSDDDDRLIEYVAEAEARKKMKGQGKPS